MRRRSDSLKAGTAARSQNYRSAIASADSFDRYYRLSDYRFLHYRPNPTALLAPTKPSGSASASPRIPVRFIPKQLKLNIFRISYRQSRNIIGVGVIRTGRQTRLQKLAYRLDRRPSVSRVAATLRSLSVTVGI